MMMPMERDGLTYAPLEAQDLDRVAEVVAQSFTDGSEPVALALGVTAEDFKGFLKALLPKFPGEGLSIVARDAQTNEICGAQLNDEMMIDLPVDPSQFPWAGPVFAVANELYRQYFQQGSLQPHHCIHLFIICVSRSSRGKGISHQLLDLSLETGRARGYRRAVVEASGLVSQHVLRKAGFTTRVEIPYATFEIEGTRPFEHTGGHPSIMLMDKDL
jgi:ribosomal protein S18 acetylase RimI-like enzyme